MSEQGDPGTYLTTAARYPRIPTRDEVAQDERDAYDYQAMRVAEFADGRYGFEEIDGHPYGVPHFEALLVSPPVAAALAGPMGLGRAVTKTQDEPGSFTSADHEWIDLVLAFDSGYWAFLGGHTAVAIAAGTRVAAIAALADGREDELTTREWQVVEFIRVVRDGGVTDKLWAGMRERFGTDRGVVDFVSHILLLLFHHRFCWAVGAPVIARDAWWQMIREFEDGTRNPEEVRERLARAIERNDAEQQDRGARPF